VERTFLSAALAFEVDLAFAFDFFNPKHPPGCPILARSMRKSGIPQHRFLGIL
jgi:hypothetical protein